MKTFFFQNIDFSVNTLAQISVDFPQWRIKGWKITCRNKKHKTLLVFKCIWKQLLCLSSPFHYIILSFGSCWAIFIKTPLKKKKNQNLSPSIFFSIKFFSITHTFTRIRSSGFRLAISQGDGLIYHCSLKCLKQVLVHSALNIRLWWDI